MGYQKLLSSVKARSRSRDFSFLVLSVNKDKRATVLNGCKVVSLRDILSFDSPHPKAKNVLSQWMICFKRVSSRNGSVRSIFLLWQNGFRT